MPLTSALGRLASPRFAVAVVLLPLNDAVLKPTFHNWWTGKLSDLAGLYALPFFLAAFLPGARRAIVVLTGIIFVVWKSPLSSGILLAWNELGVWPLTRVIDLTDWIALLILPLAYRDSSRSPAEIPVGLLLRLRGVTIGLCAIIAFSATSRPAPRYNLDPLAGYPVAGSRFRVGNDLIASGARRISAPYDRPSETGPDTLYYQLSDENGLWVSVRMELREASCGSVLTPISFETLVKHPDPAGVRATLEQRLILPLQLRFEECPGLAPP